MRWLQRRRWRIGGLVLLAMTSLPVAAAAQTVAPASATPNRMAVRFAVGTMDPIHGDDFPEGPVLLGGVGFAVSPRGWVEVEITRRAFTDIQRSVNVIIPIQGVNPTGTVGRADLQTFGRESSDVTMTVNAIYRRPWKHWAYFVGGGAGAHVEEVHIFRTLTNCTPPSSSVDGRECRDFNSRTPDGGFVLQGLAGVEVTIASRFQPFFTVRYEARPDLGMGTFGFTGGLRVAVW